MTGRPYSSRVRAGAVLALAAALLAAACGERRDPIPGEAASELSALALDGAPVRLDQFKGKVVLINFWQGGCGPCLAEMPELDAFYRAHRARGLEILALNMGEPDDAVARVARRLGVTFPVLLDAFKITADRYNVTAVPTSFVIGKDGRLVERIMGPLDAALLERKIGSLL